MFVRTPSILEAARGAIEEGTRRLTAVVSEMKQRNGELRQRVSYLEDALALAKETSGRSEKRPRMCDRESESENVYLTRADPVEWLSPRDCCVCNASTRNLCHACELSLCLRCFGQACETLSDPVQWLSPRSCRACNAFTRNRCYACDLPLCLRCCGQA